MTAKWTPPSVRLKTLFVLAATVGLTTGCSIKGKWNIANVEPTAATRDFDFMVLTLQDDGTFYAEKNDNGIHTTSGTYKYDGKVLALTQHNGETLTYDAHMPDNNTLRLEKFWRDQKVKAKFERT